MFTTNEVIENYINIGYNKSHEKKLKILLLGVFAGMFIAFAAAGANTAISTIENQSLGKLVSGIIFPAGLAMVLTVKSNLFTGDNLIIISYLNKKITGFELLKEWILVYIGNLIGSVFVAGLLVGANQFSLFEGKLAILTMKIASTKVSYSFLQAFLLGIGCNFLVCIAVLIGNEAKTVSGKIIGAFFPILLFVVSGFEHSVANMYYVSSGILAKMNPIYLEFALDKGINLDNLNWYSFFVKNLFPVTLGNIVGGAFLVGTLYYYIFKKEKN